MTKSNEEREEGEIVEDDLEDVSDCSMSLGSPFDFGKSVSPPELLSAVCLSSVSSSEYSRTDGRRVREKSFQQYGKNQPKRRMYRRKRKLIEHGFKGKFCHHIRHHRKPVVIRSNSDSDSESVDPKYANQLREALCRESSQELQNSLKTRLKAFIEPNSHSEDDTSISALRNLALLSTLKDIELADKEEIKANKGCLASGEVQFIGEIEISQDEIKEDNCNSEVTSKVEVVEKSEPVQEGVDDVELQELRIAALKSFVLENHERRKKRAATHDCNADNLCSGSSNKDDTSDIDKENDQSMINNDVDVKSKKLKVDNEKDNTENETPKQINLSVIDTNNKNLIGTSANHVDSVIEDDVDILRAMLLASMSTKLASTKTDNLPSDSTANLSKTLSDIRRVEKSKFNYNSLSVTISKPILKRTVRNNLCIKNNEHKSNEQSSMLCHAVVKPLIINVNGDSDSETENSSVNESSKTLKDNVAEFLKKQRAEVEAAVKKNPESSDSSLNKSDDLLMEKSVMKLLPRSQQLEYRKLKQQLLNARKKMRLKKYSQRLSESKREVVQINKKVPKMKTDASINTNPVSSKAIIKDVEEMKVIEPANNLQKTLNDLQIRKNGRLQMKGKYRSLAPLLHRINQASNERRQHELEIKKLLQEIQKARIKLAASHQNFTTLVQQLVHEKSTIDQRAGYKLAKFSSGLFTSTPNKLIKKQQALSLSVVKDTTTIEVSEKVDTDVEPVVQQENVVESNDTNHNKIQEEEEEVLLDPNDVTKVFIEQSATFPKYTSPLDNRDGVNDPLTTICPYDLLGVCKDKECRYVHCS